MTNKQLSIQCRMYALVAEMEGMKADNQNRTIMGYSPSYGETAFETINNALLCLAGELNE